jgi:hypothetical protein
MWWSDKAPKLLDLWGFDRSTANKTISGLKNPIFHADRVYNTLATLSKELCWVTRAWVPFLSQAPDPLKSEE